MNHIHENSTQIFKFCIIPIFSIFLVCPAFVAFAANTFVVTTTLDLPDAFPGDGLCTTDSIDNPCSLRAAIMESNASGGADVELGAGTYLLTIAGWAEDAAETGDLDITENITITGAGSNLTIISGNDLDRVFEIFSNNPATDFKVTMSQLTVTKGFLEFGQDGAGIMNYETLNLQDVKIDDNFNFGEGGGGAIWNHGTLYLNQVVISNNHSGGLAGGIANQGHAEINDSLFYANTGTAGGIYNNSFSGDLIINDTDFSYNSGGNLSGGGGILVNNGNVELTHVRFRENTASTYGGAISIVSGNDLKFIANHIILDRNEADEFGGGIYIEDFVGTVDVKINYATISNNRATRGGGIYNYTHKGNASPLRIQNSTISSNLVDFDGGGIYSTGSFDLLDSTVAYNHTLSLNPSTNGIGIYTTTSTSAEVNVQRSLIANNKAPLFTLSPDCAIDPLVTFNSLDYNLFARISSDCSFSVMPNDQIGSILVPIDPKIAPLNFNGGFSKTHKLLANSPAIDAAGTGSCGVSDDDQRGITRPQDGDNNGTFECDIGAYELEQP